MAKFVKGQSGNPNGRPKGVVDCRNQLKKLLLPHAEALIKKATELALEGDTTALKMCLDRIMPKLQPRPDMPLFAEAEQEDDEDMKIMGPIEAIRRALLAGYISGKQVEEFFEGFDKCREREKRLSFLLKKEEPLSVEKVIDKSVEEIISFASTSMLQEIVKRLQTEIDDSQSCSKDWDEYTSKRSEEELRKSHYLRPEP